MKNDKLCIQKRSFVVASVMVFLAIMVSLLVVIANTKTSTSTRASEKKMIGNTVRITPTPTPAPFQSLVKCDRHLCLQGKDGKPSVRFVDNGDGSTFDEAGSVLKIAIYSPTNRINRCQDKLYPYSIYKGLNDNDVYDSPREGRAFIEFEARIRSGYKEFERIISPIANYSGKYRKMDFALCL